MQLKPSTGMAVRTLIILAETEKYMTLQQLACKIEVKPNYLVKILKPLRDKGWITSHAGEMGGYRLAVDPEKLSLWEVINQMEAHNMIDRCLEHAPTSDAFADNPKLRTVYQTVQSGLEEYFSGVSIKSLINTENH